MPSPHRELILPPEVPLQDQHALRHHFGIMDPLDHGILQLSDLAPDSTTMRAAFLSNPFGNADIYRAVDWSGAGQEVALKIFSERDERERQRVTGELVAHIALNGQPGIIEAVGMGVIEEGPVPYRYLATLLHDGTLATYVHENPGDLDIVLGATKKLLPGLQVLHNMGVVHRDIKPENIVGNGKDWRLIDFGLVGFNDDIAVPIDDIAGDQIVSSGSLARGDAPGTIGYIAPEVFTVDSPYIGPKADIFALGVTIFNSATGEMPFETDCLGEYIHSVIEEGPPPDMRDFNKGIPARLAILTSEMLSIDPEIRPSVGRIANTLEAVTV